MSVVRSWTLVQRQRLGAERHVLGNQSQCGSQQNEFCLIFSLSSLSQAVCWAQRIDGLRLLSSQGMSRGSAYTVMPSLRSLLA